MIGHRTTTVVEKIPQNWVVHHAESSCQQKKGYPAKKPTKLLAEQIGSIITNAKPLHNNILDLKAYTLAIHNRLKTDVTITMSLKAPLFRLMLELGSKKLPVSGAADEYLALEMQYRDFYCKGIGKYLIKELSMGMRTKSILTHTSVKGRKVVVLNYKAVGLDKLAKQVIFDKLAVPLPTFKTFDIRTAIDQKKLKAEMNFVRDGCRCSGTGAHGVCKRYFAYDKL